jgi:hypothetical protein
MTNVGVIIDDQHRLVPRLVGCDLFAQLPDEGFDIDGAPDRQQI